MLVVTQLLVVPPAGAQAGGPSVELPELASVAVTQQTMGERQPDQASRQALRGDQPAAGHSLDGAGLTTVTPLSASASWDVSAHTGDFTWSYPLRVPPAPGGLEPGLTLGYASSVVDGRTSTANNQTSWVGEGWDLSAGFVERQYGGCSDDDMGGTTPPKTGDLCWRSDNAFVSYPGGSGRLVRNDADGVWRLEGDDGSRIERLTGADNGDADGEHWKITTLAGVQYFFGSRRASASAWTVPVFGDDAGEPCHAAAFAASYCAQAWRWNLDKVVDPHGNVIVYTYEAETNSYGLNERDTAVGYVRGGALRWVEYGLREGSTAMAAGQVEFTLGNRCVPGSECVTSKKDNWPDVAWDAKCDTATCPDQHAPTFWSAKRLASITTRVLKDGKYQDVDSWELEHAYPAAGDGEKPALWLKGIKHTGHVGGAASLPAVTFEGTSAPNRVHAVDGIAPLNRYRITGVVSESGGVLTVVYAKPECVAGGTMPASAHTNTLRCFPVTWAKPGYAERTDYFHKYVVAQITQSDRIGSSSEQVTGYEYLDGAAWHYDTSEFTKDKNRTWNEFRGYGRVRIRTGMPQGESGPVEMAEQRYFRGMDADAQPDGGKRTVTVTDSTGKERQDDDWLRGRLLESITYDGEAGPIVTKTISTPATTGPIATRGSLKAYRVRTGSVATYTALEAGGYRTAQVDYAYDDHGLAVTTSDLGDVTTPDDDQCTTTTYARNTAAWLLNLPARVDTVALACGKDPELPKDAVSAVRTAYDGQDFGQPPTKGDVTKAEEATEWPATGPVWKPGFTATYDVHGRPLSRSDALGRTSRYGYSPAEDGPLTRIEESNPAGHTSFADLNPAWGLPIKITNANGRVTEVAYDPLGRKTEVWLPNRIRDLDGGSVKYSYEINTDAPSVVTTQALGPNGVYITSKTLYDGLMRPRQQQAPAVGGGRLLTETRYDSHGRAFQSTQPYFNDADVDSKLWSARDTDVPGLSLTRFDGAGRTSEEVFQAGAQEKWKTSYAYGGDRVHVTPPKGGTATTTIIDARGRTTERRQYHGPAPTGVFDGSTYAYSRAGRPATMTDPAGNVWRTTYDLLGRPVETTDPDSGTSLITYDAAGQVTTVTDARGSVLAYSYDALGRKTAVRKGSATGQVLAEWTYDTVTKGKGYLASATRYDAEGNAFINEVTNYNKLGLPLGSKLTIPATPLTETLADTYTTTIKYNPDGSPDATVLPAAGDLPEETVDYSYDDLGKPTTLLGGLDGGTTTYVGRTDYTGYGEVARIELGEGERRAWVSRYYDTSTRRPERVIVDAEVPQPMQADIGFTHDPFGNLTGIADTPQDKPADIQCFRYDHLRRMTEAWTPSAADCEADPSVAALAGPAPYWHSFELDKIGNRRTETQHTAGGDIVRTYGYPDAQPHTLTSVATTAAGKTTTESYRYDATGNTVQRPGQNLSWDAEARLTEVTPAAGKTTQFLYDADGNRLIRRDPTGATLYLPGQELRLTDATGARTATRYYTHQGATIGLRDAGGVTWLSADHQNTIHTAIDADTLKVTQRRQTAFGAPRGTPATLPGERGFVGGTVDASIGLTTLGARQYDAATGRFLSDDPITNAADPQQVNGYAYANNSPVTYSDPDGLLPKSCPDGVCSDGRWGAHQNRASNPADTYNPPVNHGSSNTIKGGPCGARPCWKHHVVLPFGGKKYHREMEDHPVAAFVAEVSGLDAVQTCLENPGFEDCALALAEVTPLGKLPKVGRLGRKADDCLSNSFVPETLVLMADGTRKPIGKVKIGDTVLATDPETGKTAPRKVTRLIVGDGEKNLVQITTDTVGDKQHAKGAVIATDGHPFWAADLRKWVTAAELRVGMLLRTSAGTHVQITSVKRWTAIERVHNLTVDDLHTYYVLAGATPVLVHNCRDKVWEPFREGVDHTDQGTLPASAGISPGSPLDAGEYHFIVRQDGSLRVMQNESMWGLNPDAGHTSLGDRQGVLMAGLFDVNSSGAIFRIDNFSGHYRPIETPGYTPLRDITRAAFRRHGWDFADDAWDYYIGPNSSQM
ncbi:RHS repeat-associated protein [Nonomuraea thailandensis]|uniref:RHS repeat-associated protein n=1 Tax=Nonomuraea thailandensis TaxID=1188745 RepID=A0A9X2GEJ4_9ACTN|nr:polymorphic toxin-type HINT domain-containing protein [Nonomuraea thailandensis]MCP2353298.1 RHS repeat-associated protein [Nonomuraea thailandensis]